MRGRTFFRSTLALCLLTVLWLALIRHTWQRVEAHCIPRSTNLTIGTMEWDDWSPDCIDRLLLGADAIEYWFAFRGYPTGLSDSGSPHAIRDFVAVVGGEFWKRPLYGPISGTLNILLFATTGSAFPLRMFAILAFYAGLSSILLFWLLRTLGLRGLTALLVTAIVTTSFGWLSVFSIPESYSLSVVGLMASIISGHSLSQRTAATWPRILTHCIVTGMSACLYLPNAGAVLFLLGQRRSLKVRLLQLALSTALVCTLVLAPQMWFDVSANTRAQLNYAQQWMKPSNLSSPPVWRDVLAGFFVFSVVAPTTDFVQSPGNVDWPQILSRPTTIGAGGCVLMLYTLLLWLTFGKLTNRELLGPILWLALLVVWNVMFNPGEVLLYLAVPLGLLAFIIGFAIREIEANTKTPAVVSGALLIVLVGLLATNWLLV